METNKEIAFLNFTRKGGAVKRFHTMTTVVEDRVSNHTYGVVNLIYALTDRKANHCLIKAAQYHDIEECLIGDISTGIKQKYPNLANELKKAEKDLSSGYNFKIKLTLPEKNILKLADILEGMYYVTEEIERGNFELLSAFKVYSDKFRKHNAFPGIASVIMEHLSARVKERVGI